MRGRGCRRGCGRERILLAIAAALLSLGLACGVTGCASQGDQTQNADANQELDQEERSLEVNDKMASEDTVAAASEASATNESDAAAADDSQAADRTPSADVDALRARLDLTEDYRASFVHGVKTAAYQKYIVLHDTEGDGSAAGVVNYWDSNGSGVAAHFVINKDGSIVQCVPLDNITHHAGYGDSGHNALYGITEDGRDDMVGTTPIGSWASDYGMNAWSVGIEMVHVGGSGDYPEAQLVALDNLIAYINAYYGFQSTIIDHKAWRTGNSDTSAEFATYLANYQDHNTHL